jgi:hypothetical protein
MRPTTVNITRVINIEQLNPVPPASTLREILSNPDLREFSVDKLHKLIQSSSAERADSIGEFVENGAEAPNSDLRKIAELESHQISADTGELLRDLHGQKSYENELAFRVYHASPAARERLTTRGTRIADLGIQSANIFFVNAENWNGKLSHPVEAIQKFIFVFDKDVPKKNLSTGFLMDHVAIMPGEILEVSDVDERPDATYIMLKGVPMQAEQPVFSPFDGTEYVNFSAKKDYLASFSLHE